MSSKGNNHSCQATILLRTSTDLTWLVSLHWYAHRYLHLHNLSLWSLSTHLYSLDRCSTSAAERPRDTVSPGITDWTNSFHNCQIVENPTWNFLEGLFRAFPRPISSSLCSDQASLFQHTGFRVIYWPTTGRAMKNWTWMDLNRTMMYKIFVHSPLALGVCCVDSNRPRGYLIDVLCRCESWLFCIIRLTYFSQPVVLFSLVHNAM